MDDVIIQKAKKLLRPFKIIFSIVIICIIFQLVDKNQFISTIKNTKISLIFELAVLYTIGQLVSACKWGLILRSNQIYRTISTTIKAYFIGMFVNTAGLGTLGGDFSRALAIMPQKGERTAAISSVAADRIHGLFVLLSIGLVSMLVFHIEMIPKSIWLSSLIGLMILLILIVCLPIIIEKYSNQNSLMNKLSSLSKNALPRKMSVLIPITLISLCTHLIQIFMYYLIAITLGSNISFLVFLTAVPFVNALSALPISYHGLGIREGFFLLFFVPQLMTKEQALLMGATWFLTITLVNLGAGVFWIFSPNKQSLISKD